MIGSIVSRLIIFVLGNLYPAYASFKAIKNKDVKEYINWIIYWIAFAFFTCIETITDVFLTWLPFYYELKTLAVIWLLSPATKGSLLIYREFLYPMLLLKEENIDKFLCETKDLGYLAIIQLMLSSFSYLKNLLIKTAIKTAEFTCKVKKPNTNDNDDDDDDDEDDENENGNEDNENCDQTDVDNENCVEEEDAIFVTSGSRSETALKKFHQHEHERDEFIIGGRVVVGGGASGGAAASVGAGGGGCGGGGSIGHNIKTVHSHSYAHSHRYEAGDSSRIIRSSSCNTFGSSESIKITKFNKSFEETEKETEELPERPLRKPRTRKSETNDLKRNSEKDRNGLPGIRLRN